MDYIDFVINKLARRVKTFMRVIGELDLWCHLRVSRLR
jgi:hypothetical protein